MEDTNENINIEKFINTFEISDDKCRLCLKETNEVWQLFEINDELPRKIMACAHVQIDEGDGLPTIICLTCRQLLDVSYNFKCQVEKSDAKLRHICHLKTSPMIEYGTTAVGVNDSLTESVNQVITEAIADEMKIQQSDSTIAHNLKNHVQLAKLGTVDSTISPDTADNGNCVIMVDRLHNLNYDNNRERTIIFNVGIDRCRHDDNEHHDHNMIEMVVENEDEKKSKKNSGQGDTKKNEQIILDISRVVAPMDNVLVEKLEEFGGIKENCVITSAEDGLSDNNVDRVYHTDDNMAIEQETNVHVMETTEGDMDSDEEMPLSSRTTRYKCRLCFKTFASKLALRRHTTIHINNKAKQRFVCYMCDKQFATVNKLKNHVLSTHDSLKNVPNDNGMINGGEKNVDEKNLLIEEIIDKQDKKTLKFSCKYCPKQFTYEKPFLTHAKRHPEDESLLENKPMAIGDKLKSRNAEFAHVNELEGDDMPLEGLQCTQCGKLFATKRNLTRHLTTHTGLKFNCSACNKEFSRLDKLKEHEQIKHKNEFFEKLDGDDDDDSANEIRANGAETLNKDKHNRPHKCPLCPKAFAQAQSLNNHMERHKRVKDTQKRFLCEVCSKCFAQSGSLVAHMRTHTGVKPYVCNVCNRAFTKSTYLQLHLRTHSGEKPYICQYCSRAFARANTLARHITMHTGEAKYHCQICMKSFRRLTSLNEHTYTHTGQRPYACKICTKRYNNAGSLYAHTKKCKVQQSSSNINETSFDNITIDDDNNDDVGGTTSAIVIHSERRVPNYAVNDVLIVANTLNAGNISSSQSTTSSPSSFIITNNAHNQKLPVTNNIIQQYTVEEPNVYAINVKNLKNPYYTIYPGI